MSGPVNAPVASRALTALQDAAALISGPRQRDYGPPAQNFARAAAFATLATGKRLTARDVVHVLRAVKQARLMVSPGHADSHLDLLGYDALLAEASGEWRDTVAALCEIGAGE